jgi:hypothetical protein
MFPQFKKRNNESGIVLFIVLMTAIIIMIFSVGILTQSMNEINYAQQQIDQISSEQLAKGMWWNAYASGNMEPSMSASTNTTGRMYQMGMTQLSYTNAITPYEVNVSYDSF